MSVASEPHRLVHVSDTISTAFVN